MALFEAYWNFIGLPLSRGKGYLVDAFSFSWVDVSVQIGIALTLLSVTSWLPWPKKSGLRSWRKPLLAGPCFLATLGMGQGAFPLSLAPTAWRTPLSQTLQPAPLSEKNQETLVAHHLQAFWAKMTETHYASLDEEEALVTCNRLLDSVLQRLQTTRGREVKSVKAMGPVTTFLGLIYGGPAFHDPFFGELAIIKPEDMPSSRYWRIHATCHETAHAKGFTREMDAEILTVLAFLWSDDPRYQAMGHLAYLAKSGKAFALPPFLRTEMDSARQRRKRVEKRQKWVLRFRSWAEKWNLRNRPGKYGDRAAGEAWNPHHPFFTSVRQALANTPRPIITYDARTP